MKLAFSQLAAENNIETEQISVPREAFDAVAVVRSFVAHPGFGSAAPIFADDVLRARARMTALAS